MSWTYRVVRHKESNGYVSLAIHEVYYSSDKGTVPLVQPSPVVGETVEELRWTLEKMLKALEAPILDYEDITNESQEGSGEGHRED